MTYLTINSSRQLAEPAGLYEFTIPGTASVWRYTSSEFPITFGGNEYAPQAIKRGSVTVESGRLDSSTDILVPDNCEVAQALFLGLAARPVEVRVLSVFPGEPTAQVEFTGIFTGINFDGATAKITCGSRYAMAAKRKVLWATFQAGCNLSWGSTRCGVNKENYSADVIVAPAAITGITMNIPALSAAADGRYNGGFIKRVTDGDTRFIQSHVGATITLSGMFPNILAAEEFLVYPGCQKTEKDCDVTFGNLDNYLGWTHLPSINPFNRSAYYQTGAALAPPAGTTSAFPGLEGYSVLLSDFEGSYKTAGFTLTITFTKQGRININVYNPGSVIVADEFGGSTTQVIGVQADQNVPGCWATPLPLPNDTAADALEVRVDGTQPAGFPFQSEIYSWPSLPQDASGWVPISDHAVVIGGHVFPGGGFTFDFTVRIRAAAGFGTGVVLAESNLKITVYNNDPIEIPYGA